MEWKDCIKEGSVTKIDIDNKKINSLINAAKRKIDFVNKHQIDNTNHEILFSVFYEGILELLHSFVMKDGYHINNHICIGYYLKEVFMSKELFVIFDNCRKIRNDILYDGEIISLELARNAINELNYLNEEIIRII